jgi:hypothetical protein
MIANRGFFLYVKNMNLVCLKIGSSGICSLGTKQGKCNYKYKALIHEEFSINHLIFLGLRNLECSDCLNIELYGINNKCRERNFVRKIVINMWV